MKWIPVIYLILPPITLPLILSSATLTILLFFHHVWIASTSGILHWLFCLPGILFPQIATWINSSSLLVLCSNISETFLDDQFKSSWPVVSPHLLAHPLPLPCLIFSMVLITIWHTLYFNYIFGYGLSPSLECKPHEGREFYRFCSLLYSQLLE